MGELSLPDVSLAEQRETGETSETAIVAKRTMPGWRHLLSVLMFFIVLICYADRTNIGIVLANGSLPGAPTSEKGNILSSFFVGYMCTQILGGALSRRYGAKPVILAAVAIWTFFDVITPIAAKMGIPALFAARVGMGLGEGMLFPSQHAFTTLWVPKEERAFLVSIMTSGQDLGSVMANLVTPQLLNGSTMLAFGFWACLALLWITLFSFLGASAPERHLHCSRSGEAAWIQQHRDAPHFEQVKRHAASVCPSYLLREPGVWAIIVAHSGLNCMNYVILSWSPTFYKDKYGLDLPKHPAILAAPYLGAWVGGLVAGRISDLFVASGYRIRHVRKACQFIGTVGTNIFIQVAARSESAEWASVWMTCALFFMKIVNAGFWVNMVDVAPEAASTVMGLSNTFATIPGIVGQPITQAILDQLKSWPWAFGWGGLASFVTMLGFLAFADDKPLLDPHADRGNHTTEDGDADDAPLANRREVAVV